MGGNPQRIFNIAGGVDLQPVDTILKPSDRILAKLKAAGTPETQESAPALQTRLSDEVAAWNAELFAPDFERKPHWFWPAEDEPAR